MVYSQDASDTIIATFAPEKDVSTELHIQALVGHKMSTYYHVFELDYKLPKFSMYVPVKDFQKEPESSVRFRVTERVNRVAMWLNNSFNVGHKVDRQNLLDARFVSLRNGLLLAIHMSPENGGLTLPLSGQVRRKVPRTGAWTGTPEWYLSRTISLDRYHSGILGAPVRAQTFQSGKPTLRVHIGTNRTSIQQKGHQNGAWCVC